MPGCRDSKKAPTVHYIGVKMAAQTIRETSEKRRFDFASLLLPPRLPVGRGLRSNLRTAVWDVIVPTFTHLEGEDNLKRERCPLILVAEEQRLISVVLPFTAGGCCDLAEGCTTVGGKATGKVLKLLQSPGGLARLSKSELSRGELASRRGSSGGSPP